MAAAAPNCMEKIFEFPYTIVGTLFFIIGVENLIKAALNHHSGGSHPAAASNATLFFHLEAMNPQARF